VSLGVSQQIETQNSAQYKNALALFGHNNLVWSALTILFQQMWDICRPDQKQFQRISTTFN
jgi:hypothetical protein